MTRLVVVILVVALAHAFGAQAPLPRPVPIAEARAELRGPISRADIMIAALQDALLRELNHALEKGGPASAIDACHIDVTAAAQRLGRTQGIAAGWTSDRLRNPTNIPQAWAAATIKQHAGRRARDVEGFAVDLGEHVGVLRPIEERRMCTGCHGPEAQVGSAVRSVLTERYPADRALGFQTGEIRGWFWVEMPKILR